MQNLTTHPRILAVDDVESKLYNISRVLSRAGFDVDMTCSGLDALAAVKKKRPDLIILDVQLPDISGLEVCRRLKTQPSTASIPIIHLSATFVTPEDRVAGLDGGADGYLTEPLEPSELVATVNSLIRLKQAEEVAARAAARWQSTFEALSEGVAIVDSGGTVVQANAPFRQLFGLSAEERPPFAGLLAQAFGAGIEEIASATQRRVFERARGDRTWRISLDPFVDGDGTTARVAVVTDVTETRRAEAAMKELARGLEEKVQERTDGLVRAATGLESLTYSVSHDLRAPLRAIHGLTEILLEEYGSRFDERGKEIARRIFQASRRMDVLLADMLTYVDMAREGRSTEAVDLRGVVKAVVDTLQEEIRSSSARVRIELPEGLPAAEADPEKLRIALRNLVSNAVKFVADGVTPEVEIRAEADPARVRLIVADNGLGIAPEHHRRIFGLFEHLHPRERYPGVGMGLAIAHKAVERMNGRIGLESAPGRGSRFWIDLARGVPGHDAPPA